MKIKSGATIGLVYLFSLFASTGVNAEEYPKKADKTKGGTDTGTEVQNKSAGTNSLLAGCSEPNEKNFLEFNNVKALIYSGGDMFWDFGLGNASYEVPKGSGKHSMFLSSLWLGGTDVNGQLRIAAQRYRASGVDFWTGPLDTSGTAEVSPETCADWDKHFIISRAEVDNFVGWFNDNSSMPGYTIPKSILEWPAHGDASIGQSYYLAPFFDYNGDGFYSPNDGDYPFYDLSSDIECNRSRDREPKLFGDQTMWFVFNDKGNVHNETEGDAIGVEIHCQEFAFATNDEINNMTFTNYRIINRSTFTLIDTYFGTNFDPDVGDALDDYVGCDVKRGLGYSYNGPAIDGSGAPDHYGENPPAIGVDFFEGPFQDPDGVDNPQDSACDAYVNGSINGLNFGDGEIDNERWGMRRLVYYCNPGAGCNGGTQGDPETAVDYYSYLRGFWKDGTRMRYGGNGHVNNCTSCEYADFMFPGAQSSPQHTDECNWGVCSNPDGTNCGVTPGDPIPWTEQAAGNQASDRRFVHSAGPFTLEPGAENDITVGVIWERATSTNPFQSVELVRLADDKAQALFDNCFRVLNGPDAPVLTCQEMNQELILYISNPSVSNNYLEQYEEIDPLIISPDSFPGKEDGKEVDNKYHFQGYQIYQLKDATVSVSDISDIELARLVAQVDLKDSVTKLVNFEFDESIGAEVPTLMVNGPNNGISHSFHVTEDLFALGDKKLVNHKKYYFLALAYAYNQYQVYTLDPSSPIGDGNKRPYLAGRKTGFGSSIQSTTCVPHKTAVESGGTQINSTYGDSPVIVRVEGQGNGGRVLELTQSTIDNIMSGYPWKAKQLSYQKNQGPVSIKVVDPLSVQGGSYSLKFYYDAADQLPISNMANSNPPPNTAGFSYFGIADDPRGTLDIGDVFYVTGSTGNDGEYTVFDIAQDNGKTFWKILTEEWISDNTVDGVINPFYRWALTKAGTTDTLYVSEQGINVRSEQLIPELGISVTVEQVRHPGPAYAVPLDLTGISAKPGQVHPNAAAGFLEATMTFDNPNAAWLTGVQDGDAASALNWIKAGTAADDYVGVDEDEVWENVLGGTWAPGKLASNDSLGITYDKQNNDRSTMKNLASVDLVITSDKSKWTRAVVLEQEENPNYTKPLGSNTPKFNLRSGLSIDKNGNPVDTTGGIPAPSTNPNAANYIASTGMGWFPGYAINIETGERLNIMYGEDSWLINGNDMMWNPTSDLSDPLGEAALEFGTGCIGCPPTSCGTFPLPPCLPYWAGGKHVIYIMGHNADDTTNIAKGRGDLPSYDGGEYIRQILDGSPADNAKMAVFKDLMWTGIPLLTKSYTFSNPASIPTDVTIKFRVEKPYVKHYATKTDSTFTATLNDNNPMYNFNLDDFAVRTNVDTIAESQLALINVVPNPYFAFSEYETSQIDHRIKITNLPVKCTVSIYNLNGTLIRQYDRDDNTITSIDWDLKNQVSVPVASGVYLIHVNAPGIGERVIKWFGVLRPIDLDSF